MVASILALAVAGAALAGVSALSGTTTTRVTVTEVEYKLTLSRTHLSVGKTTLVVVNKGKLAHSLSISGPGLKKRLIPGTIKPGTSRSMTVTLKSGTYTLWCPVPGHAALGMKTRLMAAGTGTGAGTSGTTTTGSTWG
jgi:plastocyanin